MGPLLTIIIMCALFTSERGWASCSSARPNSVAALVNVAQAVDPRVENTCGSHSGTASDADKMQLLVALKDAAIEHNAAIEKDLGKSNPGIVEQVRALRLTMATRHIQIRVKGDKSFEIVPDPFLTHLGGFAKPSVLTRDEVAQIRSGYKTQIDYINSLPDLRSQSVAAEAFTTQTRASAELKYSEMVSEHPYLFFIPQANPTSADIEAGLARYKTALAEESRNLKDLTIDPTNLHPHALVFNTPVVRDVLRKRPELCAAFSSLKAEAAKAEKLRSLVATGTGLASGGACLAAAIVSEGILGAGCAALSAGATATSGYAALQDYREKQVLYDSVLHGGNLRDYEQKRDQVNSFLVSAGVQATIGAGASGVKALGSLSKAAVRETSALSSAANVESTAVEIKDIADLDHNLATLSADERAQLKNYLQEAQDSKSGQFRLSNKQQNDYSRQLNAYAAEPTPVSARGQTPKVDAEREVLKALLQRLPWNRTKSEFDINAQAYSLLKVCK